MTAPAKRRWTYRGRVVEAPEGSPAATALADRGVPVLGRSARFRRPLAPFCGTGDCTACLVRASGRAGVPACRLVPDEGGSVSNELGWPSPRWDIGGVRDLLYARGRGPSRDSRGPERGPTNGPAPPTASVDREVVVLGGGRSGRSVTDALVRAGVRPLLVDRGPGPGEVPGAEVRAGLSLTIRSPPATPRSAPFVLRSEPETVGGIEVRARAVVVATGRYDAGLLFGGNDRPGVLTAEAAIGFSRSLGRAPFRTAVVFGGARRAHEVLDRFGENIAAVAAPGEIRPEVVRTASELSVPLYPRSLVLHVSGRTRVRAVHLRTRGRGPRFSLPCDAVILAHRSLPDVPTLVPTGARLAWDEAEAAYGPVVDASGATTVAGLYAVGGLAGPVPGGGPEDLDRTARAIVDRTPVADRAGPRPSAGPNEIVGYYQELLGERRRGRWMACRCEEILLEELERAVRGTEGPGGSRGANAVGTGRCRGRYCLSDAVVLRSILERRTPHEVASPFLASPPPSS